MCTTLSLGKQVKQRQKERERERGETDGRERKTERDRRGERGRQRVTHANTTLRPSEWNPINRWFHFPALFHKF